MAKYIRPQYQKAKVENYAWFSLTQKKLEKICIKVKWAWNKQIFLLYFHCENLKRKNDKKEKKAVYAIKFYCAAQLFNLHTELL